MSVDLCLEELFEITKSIDDNYEELFCLSKNDKEDSKEYNDTLITLYKNVESSVVFCQNQSIETLQEMIRKINIKIKTNLDGYYYYTAAMNAVAFVYNKKCAQDYSQEEQDEVVSEEIFDEIYQDDEASATRRINKAKMDMELAPLFQNVVKSEDADKTYQAVKDVILKELHKDA